MNNTTKRLFVAAAVFAVAATSTPAGVASGPSKQCAIALATATPIGATACPGVRPGALVEIPKSAEGDAFCTMGFVFTDSVGRSYITTAGHCVMGPNDTLNSGHEGTKVWASGTGPVALDSAKKQIGRYVFAVQKSSSNLDFGLIQLTVKANPQMCHFGGPTGVISTHGSTPAPIEYYGNGVGIGDVVPARSAIVMGLTHSDQVDAIGVSTPGDSGAPVLMSNGKALGYIVSVGVGFDFSDPTKPTAGDFFIDRLGPQVKTAASALHTTLTLVMAKAL